jgi:peptidoglycan/LPS O-acetylase OafA/YrhL
VGRRTGAYAYQPALDGIRAVAVAAVLAFHGGVAFLPGGFLGVDAFFVLSGFLITSLLLAELASTGTIGLLDFWARRARRLLPALLVVVAVVATTARWLVPAAELGTLRGDALSSLAYVANWRMIWHGNDYFALTSTPSALQHTWSLGIEEQFYLCWPLVLVVLAAAIGRGRMAAAVIVTSLVAAAASIAAAAALFDPRDSARAYFGTDTRAQSLLIGCAAAALIALAPDSPRRQAGATIRLTAAIFAVGGIGWLWGHAHGGDSWLYRGGLTAEALAVAVVIAHVVLDPHAPLARALAWVPAVWLGRISYGVYLWHWPLFQLLSAGRTGLRGPALLGLRCGVTIAVAATSYALIEQPIRAGRWRPVRPPVFRARVARQTAPVRGRRALTARARAGLGTAVLVCAIGLYAVAATVTGPAPRGKPVIAAPAAGAREAAQHSPMRRPGRRPGTEPRVVFLGDSVSWTLGTYLPPHPGLSVTVRAIQGCGIARLPDVIQLGKPHTNYPACPTWDDRWRRAIRADDPDVAVILLDRWELMDRKVDGAYRHVGDPVYDAYLTRELELAESIAASRGARVVLLTAPYTHRAERPDGSIYDEDRPERVDAWNRLLRATAAKDPRHRRVIDLNARVCPDGRFTWSIDGLRVRSDGLHFTPEGVQRRIAPWLLPQLATLASQ